MSVLTEVLNLFKYDPATDGDMAFNIGQCMNDNWDKLDTALLLAIAAAGAYNPEESYAVGDYCTYKGKLRKCSTAIPTGETWTETHWTTTTVAAELAELSSQLSNLESALTTPPQEFNLPLAEPYDGLGKYLKTQENIVIVDVNIGTTSGAEISNNNMTFATLPAGFRPSRVVYSDAVTLTSDSGAIVGIAQFWIDTNGSLNLRVPSGSYRLRGELVFLAAN